MSWLAKYLTPDEFCDSIYDIDPYRLAGQGWKVVYLDIDNTLLPFGAERPTLKCQQWVMELRGAGLFPLILSNNRYPSRVEQVAQVFDIPAVCWALKPFPWALRAVQAEFGLRGKPSVLIGDQVLTDVILGKTQGFYTILVKPIRLDNKPSKALQFQFEQMLLRFFGVTQPAH